MNLFDYKSGDRYAYLMLTGKALMQKSGGKWTRYVECICDCGKTWFTRWYGVKSGGTKSCGCKKNEIIQKANTIHGMNLNRKVHPIYRAFQNMHSRCNLPVTNKGYKNYVGKGISVCEEWDRFPAFYKWAIENGWKQGLSLDRYPNNDGNYEPSNCRWATIGEQNRNKGVNVFITAFGETKCVRDWENDERCTVNFTTLTHRIDNGWNPEDAISIASFNLKGNNVHKKNAVILEYNNERKLLTEWCSLLNLKVDIVRGRLYNGFSVKDAFEKPVRKSPAKKVING